MEVNHLEAIQRLYDDTGLLDILMSFEEYLDSMDLYVFKNWDNAEVVEGPVVSKYWVEVTLLFKASNPPDPRGALLFKNQGTIIKFKKDFREVPIRMPDNMDDMDTFNNGMNKPKIKKVPVFLFKFIVPRRLIDPKSSEEYNVIDAENMTNILIDREGGNQEQEPEQAQEAPEGDIQTPQGFTGTTGGY